MSKIVLEEKNTYKGGIGFFGILQIAFIILKLCKTIDWSWFWVLSPLWIPFGLTIVILMIIGIIIIITKNR